jgi:hypothetical protein
MEARPGSATCPKVARGVDRRLVMTGAIPAYCMRKRSLGVYGLILKEGSVVTGLAAVPRTRLPREQLSTLREGSVAAHEMGVD